MSKRDAAAESWQRGYIPSGAASACPAAREILSDRGAE